MMDVHADMSLELERRLLPIAERARHGDEDARDALFIAFQPKLRRFYRRVQLPRRVPGQTGVWDADDVEQEAWIVFDQLIRTWTPARPFGRYILANFPWRLRDAVYRGIARRGMPPRMTVVPIDDGWLRDERADDAFNDALTRALAASLPATQRTILMRHASDGITLTTIARELGISRRTVTRHWRTVRHQLMKEIAT